VSVSAISVSDWGPTCRLPKCRCRPVIAAMVEIVLSDAVRVVRGRGFCVQLAI